MILTLPWRGRVGAQSAPGWGDGARHRLCFKGAGAESREPWSAA